MRTSDIVIGDLRAFGGRENTVHGRKHDIWLEAFDGSGRFPQLPFSSFQ